MTTTKAEVTAANNDDNDNASVAVEVAPSEAVKMTREQLREKFFQPDNIKRKRFPFTYFGVDLEWYQPTVQMVADLQDRETGRNFVIELLMRYSYLPESEEKFFEDDDYEKLINQPINADFQKITNVIVGGINLNIEDKVKNSE